MDRSLGDLTARGFRFSFPNDVWSAHLSYREFGDDYQPSLGFVAKNGFRRWEPRIGWSPRPASIDWIRQFEFAAQFRNLTELGTGHSGGTGVATQPVGRRLAAGSGTGTGPASTCGRRFGPTRA